MIPFIDFPNSITCIDKDGNKNDFRFNLAETKDEYDRRKWVFKIIPAIEDVDDWFEFSIVKINDATGKVSAMNNNREKKYMAKGIPNKMIEETAEVLMLQIISSTNNESFKLLYTEWRSLDAEKVWKRMVKEGRAEYDLRTDTFTFIG